MKLLRSASSRLGRKFLDVRALHPERSLAEHYNPLAMAPELVKAHDALDSVAVKISGSEADEPVQDKVADAAEETVDKVADAIADAAKNADDK